MALSQTPYFTTSWCVSSLNIHAEVQALKFVVFIYKIIAIKRHSYKQVGKEAGKHLN